MMNLVLKHFIEVDRFIILFLFNENTTDNYGPLEVTEYYGDRW